LTTFQKECIDRDDARRFDRAQAVAMGIDPFVVLRMTPAQIQRLVFYPRHGKGARAGELVRPTRKAARKTREPSLDRDLKILRGMKPLLKKGTDYSALVRRLKERHAQRSNDGPGPATTG
jgi:hypothetical protein